MVDTLEVATRELFGSLLDTTKHVLLDNALKLITDMFKIDISKIDMNILLKIAEFIKIPFTIVTRSEGKQAPESWTLVKILEKISAEHFHKSGDYVCDYHQESLFSHLIVSMLMAVAESSDKSKEFQFQCGILALLHDVGKPGTLSIFDVRESKYVGFPFHGELGCMILHSMYDEKTFKEYFTKNQWDDLSRATGIHMCGYHSVDIKQTDTQIKWNHYRLESDPVKDLLCVLSQADAKACVSLIDKPAVNKKVFGDYIGQKFDTKIFDQLFTHPATKALLIMVRGVSCAGKSTVVKKLKEYLSQTVPANRLHIIERDLIMCQYVAEVLSEPVPTERPTGEQYSRYYQEYKKLQESSKMQKGKEKQASKKGKWKDDKDNKDNKSIKKPALVVQDINTIMSARIKFALSRGDVVIVDTVALLFPSANAIIPEECFQNTIRVAIDVNRLSEITEEDAKKNNLSLTRQLDLCDNLEVLNRLPGSRQNKKAGWLQQLTSIMTSNNLLKEFTVSRFKPHCTYQISWNNSLSFGQEYMFNQIDKLLPNMELYEDQMDIRQLVEHLYTKYKGDTDAMCNWFSNLWFTCMPIFKDTSDSKHWFRITYVENACKEWSTRWSRQCRGVVIHIDKFGFAHCVSRKLQRGAEMLTKLHTQQGITESQEVKVTEQKEIKTHHKLDPVQLYTMNALLNNCPIKGVLTSKVDGSLFSVTLLKKDTYLEQEVSRMNSLYGDEFSKTVSRIAHEKKLPFVPVISTQNTFFMCDIMQSYTVTALAVFCNVYTDDELIVMAKDKKPFELLETVLPPFLEKLVIFYSNLPRHMKSDSQTLSFETVCRNRTTAWAETHTELTISYPKSDCVFLGMTYNLDNSTGMYAPHFTLTDAIKLAGFNEPLWWKISDGAVVVDMVRSLDNILTKPDEDEGKFLETYKPENMTASPHLDYEGFVFFTLTDAMEVRSEAKTKVVASVQEQYDYSKIKTEAYYKGHKYHDYNIKYLLSLPDKAMAHLPLAREVREFFLNMPVKLISVAEKIYEDLKEFSVCDDYSNEPEFQMLYDSLPEGPKRGFDKNRDPIKKMRIISANADGLFFPYFKSQFSSMSESKDLDCILKALVLKIEPWETSKYKDKVSAMITGKDTTLCKFFDHIKNPSSEAMD